MCRQLVESYIYLNAMRRVVEGPGTGVSTWSVCPWAHTCHPWASITLATAAHCFPALSGLTFGIGKFLTATFLQFEKLDWALMPKMSWGPTPPSHCWSGRWPLSLYSGSFSKFSLALFFVLLCLFWKTWIQINNSPWLLIKSLFATSSMSFFLLQCCCHRNPLNVVTPRSWLRELAKQEMMSTADEEFGNTTDSMEPFQTETIHNGALLHSNNSNLIHYICTRLATRFHGLFLNISNFWISDFRFSNWHTVVVCSLVVVWVGEPES